MLLKYLERKQSALPDKRARSSTLLRGKDLKLENEAVEHCVEKTWHRQRRSRKKNRQKI